MATVESTSMGASVTELEQPRAFATGENAVEGGPNGVASMSADSSRANTATDEFATGSEPTTQSTDSGAHVAEARAGSEGEKRGEKESEGRGELSEQEKASIAENVLKQVQQAKLLRLFKTRLELAAFKSKKGWFDAPFPRVEDFCEAEAVARRQTSDIAANSPHQHHQHLLDDGQQHAYSHQPHHPSHAHLHAPFADHHAPPQANYDDRQFAPSEGPMGPPVASSAKRARASGASSQGPPPSAASGSNSSHNQPAVPTHFGGTYSNATAHFQYGSLDDAHRAKRRMLDDSSSSSRFGQTQAQGPTQNGKNPGDANFDSFVGAANVLSGLSRGPSSGSDSRNGTADGDGGHQQEALVDRPQTPPRGNTTKSPFKNSTDNDPANAAELMLLFAASPSPVRTRTNTSNLGGDSSSFGGGGAGSMKGRRLFSNDGGLDAPSPRERTVSEHFGSHHHAASTNGNVSNELDGGPSSGPFDFDAAFGEPIADRRPSQQDQHQRAAREPAKGTNASSTAGIDEPTTPSRGSGAGSRSYAGQSQSHHHPAQQNHHPSSSQHAAEPWNDFLAVPASPERRMQFGSSAAPSNPGSTVHAGGLTAASGAGSAW